MDALDLVGADDGAAGTWAAFGSISPPIIDTHAALWAGFGRMYVLDEQLLVHWELGTRSRLPEAQQADVQRLPLGRGAVEQWRGLVCNAPFTWDCGWALAVIDCESSGHADAVNPAGPFVGLFQVLNGTTDPYQNAVDAHIKYHAWQRGEVGPPWPNCP